VTVPATEAPLEVAATVKVVEVIVEGSIASLKVALMACLMGTDVAELIGTVEMTVGAVSAAATVLKVQE
jgi:hypothetical protein